MAQLKEDEWPDHGEPTTADREPPSGDRADDQPAPADHQPAATPTVPVTNTGPDEAVD